MAVSASSPRAIAPVTSITVVVIVASIVMSLSMGVRQSLGLFLPSVTSDLAIPTASFAFALALQNLVWGLSQPVLGALGDRYGARPVLVGSALVYAAGLLLTATQGRYLGLDLGAGLLVGMGVAGTGFGVLLGAVARIVPAERRSQTVGLVSAFGSVATLVIAPLGQWLISTQGWRPALLVFAALAGSMALIALLIGPKPEVPSGPAAAAPVSARAALAEAFAHPGYLAMTIAFFACGFQLMFITTHLPAYLALCGVPPTVSATALGVIGLCNAFGSYAAGLLGARFSPRKLLALIYLFRTLAIVCFLAVPASPVTTLLFAGAMGFLWLSVAPLVSSLIGRLFGVANFNMLFGMAFLSHQVGAFLGSWLGGVTFDLTGSYGYAWGAMVVIGLSAFTVQWFMDDAPRPTPRGGFGPRLAPA